MKLLAIKSNKIMLMSKLVNFSPFCVKYIKNLIMIFIIVCVSILGADSLCSSSGPSAHIINVTVLDDKHIYVKDCLAAFEPCVDSSYSHDISCIVDQETKRKK